MEKEINNDLASSGEKINSDLAFTLSMINSGFFLKSSSLRKVDRRRFCGETEGVLLCLAREPRQTEPAAKAAGGHKVNSPHPAS